MGNFDTAHFCVFPPFKWSMNCMKIPKYFTRDQGATEDHDPVDHLSNRWKLHGLPSTTTTCVQPWQVSTELSATLHACWKCQKPNWWLYSCSLPRDEAIIKRNRQLSVHWLRKNRTNPLNLVKGIFEYDRGAQLAKTDTLLCDANDDTITTREPENPVRKILVPPMSYCNLVSTSHSLINTQLASNADEINHFSSNEVF